MIVSERIIKVLKERNMTQAEFAKQVGISTSTISEWKKRKTNPTVDKIMDICYVLQITPEQLLTGKGIEDEKEIAMASPENRFTPGDVKMIEDYHNLNEDLQKRLMAYMEALTKIENLEKICPPKCRNIRTKRIFLIEHLEVTICDFKIKIQ